MTRSTFLLLFFVLILGGIGGFWLDHTYFTPKTSVTSSMDKNARQIRQGGYSLINPLLECEVGQQALSKQFNSFRYKIEDEVTKLKNSGAVDAMSVYFRDLNNGVGFGVNQTEAFTPASLLKVPVMIAYYKASESDPGLFKKKYKYTADDLDVMETVKPSQPMIQGKEYTIEDLLYRMIVFSDNNAMALLVENLPLPVQDRVYKDLGITIPGVRGTEDYMSVSDNASFFRILYNASYLSKDNSEKALNLLTKVDFSQGIRAGVPKSVPVANKFGERSENGKQQLHDCGIVYFPDHPYLLCLMTRGSDFPKLAESLEDISHLIYTEAVKQNNP